MWSRRRSRMMNGGRAVALTLLAVGLHLATTHVGSASVTSYIYGIDDSNNIWQVDPSGQDYDRVFLTGLPGTANSNAFAYDTDRDEMFFLYNPVATSDKNLWYWNHGSTITQIATFAQIGSPSTMPANAAYYGDAFWFFNENTTVLNKVSLTYSGLVPAFNSLDKYAISGIKDGGTQIVGNNTFGDIAITSAGTLYAATTGGAFYTVDLTALVGSGSTGTGSATVVKASGNPSLQIAFNADYSTLYATNYQGGQWYTMNTADGSLSAISGFQTVLSGTTGFRDLGGSSIISVPEPSSLVAAGLALGGLGAIAVARGTRRR